MLECTSCTIELKSLSRNGISYPDMMTVLANTVVKVSARIALDMPTFDQRPHSEIWVCVRCDFYVSKTVAFKNATGYWWKMHKNIRNWAL